MPPLSPDFDQVQTSDPIYDIAFWTITIQQLHTKLAEAEEARRDAMRTAYLTREAKTIVSEVAVQMSELSYTPRKGMGVGLASVRRAVEGVKKRSR